MAKIIHTISTSEANISVLIIRHPTKDRDNITLVIITKALKASHSVGIATLIDMVSPRQAVLTDGDHSRNCPPLLAPNAYGICYYALRELIYHLHQAT